MVAISIIPRRLFTRDDSDGGDSEDGQWGTMQIAAPVIVGGVLLLAFAAYLIWQRKPFGKRSYNYYPVRSDWVNKIPRMFASRRKRHRVHHLSDPVSLDDSMQTCGLDFGRARPHRSGSSDSQTPLTTTSYAFDYPPKSTLSESPPPIAQRHPMRWWWLFGSRPREVKPEEPGSRWRIDGPDGSSTGHGHSSSHGHEEYHARLARARALANVPEDPREELEGMPVIQIGGDFTSTVSIPMTQHFPEQVLAVRGMPTAPDYVPSSRAHTPATTLSAPQSGRVTPIPSAPRGFPPSYDDSHSHWVYPLEENIVHHARPWPHMVAPPPVRTVGYSSPRALHGRELSSDSFLAAQPPMVVSSMY